MATPNTDIIRVKCKRSASALPNNLVSLGGVLAYVHKSTVYLVQCDEDKFVAGGVAEVEKCPYRQGDVAEIAALSFSFGRVLAVVSFKGVLHLYDESGRNIVHAHSLEEGKYSHGLASDGRGRLFVGGNDGLVHCFDVSRSGLRPAGALELPVMTEDGTTAPVVELAHVAGQGWLVVADAMGRLYVWNTADGSNTLLSTCEPVLGHPVTSMDVYNSHVLLAGYSTGHVRGFLITPEGQLQMMFEASAHTRAVSGLTIDQKRGLVATVSEDTHLNLWNIPTAVESPFASVASTCITNCVLTGVALCGSRSDVVVMTVFDSSAFRVWLIP